MSKKTVFLGGLMIVLLSLLSPLYSQTVSQTAPLPERFAEIKDLKGDVKVKIVPNAEWESAKKGTRISEGGEIKTGKDSIAVVVLDKKGETGVFDVRPNTWMRISDLRFESSEDKKTSLDLALGQVLVQAEKLKGKSVFVVRTPTSTTSVRGTIFEVKVEEA